MRATTRAINRDLILVLALCGVITLLPSSAAASSSYSSVVLTDSPLAYWRLGEVPPSGTAVDASPNNHPGTYFETQLGISGAIVGDSNTAATLSSISSSSIDGGTLSPAAVELWIKAPSDGTLVSRNFSGTGEGSWTVDVYQGQVRLTVQHDSECTRHPYASTVTDNSVSLTDGAWHYVAVNVATAQIYVDGVSDSRAEGGQEACPPLPGSNDWDPIASPLTVGTGQAINGTETTGIDASIDELAIYDHVLPADRVVDHFTASGPDTSNEPALSGSDESQLITLATNDSRLQTILGGSSYTVGPVTMWTKSGGAVTIGGVVRLDLAQPRDITADWPEYIYNTSENTDPVYETTVVHFTAPQVAALDVSVDLNCGTVVGIVPDNDDATGADDAIVSAPVQPPACGDPVNPKAWVRNVQIISEGNTAFYNYEFYDRNDSRPDGPINMIVWGGAIFTKPQVELYDGGGGSSAYGYVTNSLASGPPSEPGAWDEDGGHRSRLSCHEDTHYRLWGQGDGLPAPNNYWGYFYVGNAHTDLGDNPFAITPCPRKEFGHYERAESRVASLWAGLFGANSVARNRVRTLNPEGQSQPAKGYMDGNHWRGNDGLATKLQACFDNNGNRRNC